MYYSKFMRVHIYICVCVCACACACVCIYYMCTRMNLDGAY